MALARDLGQQGYARATYVNRKAQRLRRGLHHRRRRPDDHHAATASPARSTTSCTATPTWRGASTRRSTSSRRYRAGSIAVGERPLDRAARERRQLRGRGGEQPGDPVAHRRLSRRSTSPIAASRWAVSTTSSATRSGVWAIYSFDLHAVRPAGRRAALSLQLAADLQPGRRRRAADARSRAPPIPATSRLPASQPVFFGARGSQEFEDYALVDLGRDLRRSGVAVAAAVGEARSAEPVQQPAADLVGHHGHRRPQRTEGRQRPAAELHHRSELRQGDVERQLRPARVRASTAEGRSCWRRVSRF